MTCPRCGNTTNGTREGDTEYCTTCGGVLGPSTTPDGAAKAPTREELYHQPWKAVQGKDGWWRIYTATGGLDVNHHIAYYGQADAKAFVARHNQAIMDQAEALKDSLDAMVYALRQAETAKTKSTRLPPP